MNINEVIRKKFAGFNIFWWILTLVICLRFSAAEWDEKTLGIRLLYSLLLLLGIIGLGLLVGAINLFININKWKKTETRTKLDTTEMGIAFLGGLKTGLMLGWVAVLVIGLMMVKDFLGVLQDLLDALIDKIL